jgi:transposase-like protein
MAKRRAKCVFCGCRDLRTWRFCSSCGRQYQWKRPEQFERMIADGWKQVAALFLLAIVLVAIIT